MAAVVVILLVFVVPFAGLWYAFRQSGRRRRVALTAIAAYVTVLFATGALLVVGPSEGTDTPDRVVRR